MLLSTLEKEGILYEEIPYVDEYMPDPSEIFAVWNKGSDFKLLMYINDNGTLDICNACAVRDKHFIFIEVGYCTVDLFGKFKESHLFEDCYIKDMNCVRKAIMRKCRYFDYFFNNKIMPNINKILRTYIEPSVVYVEGKVTRRYKLDKLDKKSYIYQTDYLFPSVMNYHEYFKKEED